MQRAPREPTGHLDAAFGVLARDGGVLLVQNDRIVRGAPTPVWDLPGGTAASGESIADALRREWREEVDLEVVPGPLRLVVDGTKRHEADGPARYTWRAFVFDVASDGVPQPGAGIRACAFVPEADLPARLSAGYHAPLREHLAGDARRYRRVEWIDEVPAIAAPLEASLASLCRLAASGAVGDAAGVAAAVEAARAADVPAATIAEVLLQLVPYCGFPRAITAFGAAASHLKGLVAEAVAMPDDAAARGAATFEAVYGTSHERIHEALVAAHPQLAAWTRAFAYGTVLSRDDALDLVTRELLAVSILAALGNAAAPLEGHRRAALRLGATPEQVAAAAAVSRA